MCPMSGNPRAHLYRIKVPIPDKSSVNSPAKPSNRLPNSEKLPFICSNLLMEENSHLGPLPDGKVQGPAIRDACKWRGFRKVPKHFLVVLLLFASVFGFGKLFLALGAGPWAYVFSTLLSLLWIVLFFVVKVLLIEHNRRNIVRQHRLELCREVLVQKPGTALEKWDAIAVLLNKQALQHCTWAPCDGATFFRYFRTLVYIPLQDGKLDGDAQIAMLRDAAQTYEKSIFDCEQENETTDHVSSVSSEKKLPIEIYRSKATWILSGFKKEIFFTNLTTPTLMYNHWWFLIAIYECYLLISFYFFWNRANELSLANSLEFMNTVHEFRPWEDESKWDDIARAMNATLPRQQIGGFGNEFFFDGNNCRRLYDKRLSSIIADRRSRLPELIPYAHEMRAACRSNLKGQV
ncbi:LAME_0E11914g1_1 [Lachancea meyersii CBS 8951]|uniref:LAME_0E11914g1_1 n=1 Tax=Lachancea meyersii CBS 8951 TaxID=1266667 RepID=A0A1G4JLB3_9SACH|nr:LAME_0E11914g1_1 [Lachancea meyersii CBS 8951]